MTPSTEQLLSLPTLSDQRVPEDHIDQNGHMNIAHYFREGSIGAWRLVVDRATGEDYIERRGLSLFTVEHRIAYLGELRAGERYSVHATVVARTDKAVHTVAFVVDRERDRVACRMELVYVHVDMEHRRAASIPDDVAASLDEVASEHPWVAEVATGLSLRR